MKRIKKFVIFLVLVLVAFFLVAYTYEGEIDPKEFLNWKQVEGSGRWESSLIWTAVLSNPDKESKIKEVRVYILVNQKLIGYRYFKQNELFMYQLDMETDKYIRTFLSKEETKKCMKCHKDMLVAI